MDLNTDLHDYLTANEYIDWQSDNILEKAKALSNGLSSDEDIARACFEFVRDDIKHSRDFQLNPVTCKASDVLTHGTGYCYAKSHLLAALLRANNIPSGLCYQRLTLDNGQPPFCLHGLNAVYLKEHGWYKIDPRGNKQGVDAQFMPPNEQLAFPIEHEGESDLPDIYSEPLPNVIECLTTFNTWQEVESNLPDTEITSTQAIMETVTVAFAQVTLKNGIGLWEAHSIANYEPKTTQIEKSSIDEKLSWQSIKPKDLQNCHSALSFFDARGMQFHLPAYLIASITENVDDPIFCLTNPNSRNQFTLFNAEQKYAVSQYLTWCSEQHEYEFERADILKALNEFWLDNAKYAD